MLYLALVIFDDADLFQCRSIGDNASSFGSPATLIALARQLAQITADADYVMRHRSTETILLSLIASDFDDCISQSLSVNYCVT